MNTRLIVFALILIFAVLAISASARISGTCDEIAHHIPVGYILLTKLDFKMDTSQPPLPRYIIALPLKLFMKINIPPDKMEWRREDRSSFGRDFFYKYNTDPKKMIMFSRMGVIIAGILCGLLLFRWAFLLYGKRAALLGLFLYCLSPNMLAHSSLATTDMIAAFFILLSAYSFWLFLRAPYFNTVLLSGICLGMAQLSKYSAILLYPAFLLVLLFEFPAVDRSGKLKLALRFAAIAAISLLVIWAGYGFRTEPILKDTMRQEEKAALVHDIASKLPASINLEKIAATVPMPLGEHLLGIMGVMRHSQESRTYFMGRWSSCGSPMYFLVAFLIKDPLPMIIFLIAGLFVMFKIKIGSAERVILATLLIFFTVSSFGNLQIGIRHILPILPLCFIIAGRGGSLFLDKKYLVPVFWILIAWHVISCAGMWPDYIGYFNELAGGPGNGYKYLRDSNIDWGQDLPALAEYMKKNNIEKVSLEYFGQADPADYGVSFDRVTSEEFIVPGNKVYAVSVNYLDHVKWAAGKRPSGRAGCSIFIYDFRKGNS